ncbi:MULTISPECIES: DUF6884 domain-containing protein [Listeria]|uniref:DUF6884 domain-containing protein n=1 Tax=Listeria TaxID=1637 RepID=UPI000B58EE5C|nr:MULTISPECIES: DUF6884 domain-containing protein [Listeria]
MMIIPSGKPKIWDKNPKYGPCQARKAYTGTFHKLCQAYAEKFADEYVILSPKYGFLHPNDTLLKTYDVRFNQKGVTAETIQLDALKAQWRALKLENQESIILLGGKKYGPLLEQITGGTQQFVQPLIGYSGIGVMQAKLKQAILSNQPLNACEHE